MHDEDEKGKRLLRRKLDLFWTLKIARIVQTCERNSRMNDI